MKYDAKHKYFKKLSANIGCFINFNISSSDENGILQYFKILNVNAIPSSTRNIKKNLYFQLLLSIHC